MCGDISALHASDKEKFATYINPEGIELFFFV